jgi:hypothetical protein
MRLKERDPRSSGVNIRSFERGVSWTGHVEKGTPFGGFKDVL